MIRALTLAVAIAGIAAAAPAQTTGSIRSGTAPVDVPEGRSTGDAARAVSDNFALCIVKRHYGQAQKMLMPPLDRARDFKDLPKLMDGDCFGGGSGVRVGYGSTGVTMDTNPVAFRGALYKALVRKDFMRRKVTFGATPLAMTGDNAQNLQFADCVVRADPENSLKLFQANAGAPAEWAAITALKPRLDQCTPKEMRMAFSKGSLIGFLAEAYYREADASKPTSSN